MSTPSSSVGLATKRVDGPAATLELLLDPEPLVSRDLSGVLLGGDHRERPRE